MSRRSLLILAVAAALVAPGAVVSAAPAAVTLAGTVRITATTTSVIEVRIPKAVDVGDGQHPTPGTSVTGDGRAIGALLLRADLKTPSIYAVRYGFCKTAGCRPPFSALYFHSRDDRDDPGHEQLSPGDYRLVILTDGRPVTVVLKFPGLRGTLNLKPKRAIPVRHETPTYTGDTGNLVPGVGYTGSAPVSVDGGLGLLLHQFTVATDLSAQQHAGFCFYRGEVQAEPAPECPGGSGHEFTFTEVKADPGRWAMYGVMRYLDVGRYRAGTFYRTVGTAHDPVGVITSLTLPPR